VAGREKILTHAERIVCCGREIAVNEEQLKAGHPESRGLALADWLAELRIVEAEREKPPM
jgi:hypothetical protein